MEKTIRERVAAALPELKKLIFADAAPATKVEAAKVTLVDGTEVMVTPAVEVGATATVVGQDGNEIPAPDGEHEVQDGTIIKIEGGVITEVKPIEDKKPEPAPEFAKAQVVAQLSAQLAEVKAEAAALKVQLASQLEAAQKMFEVVNLLAGEPAKEATEGKKKVFEKVEKPDYAAKLASALSKLNPTT